MRRTRRVVLISLAVLTVAGGGVAAAVVVSNKHDKPAGSPRAAAPVNTTGSDTETTDTTTADTETAVPDTTESTTAEPQPQATTSQPQQPANDPDLQRLLQQVVQTHGIQDGADLTIFALLYDHLKTGHQIPVSVAMASLDKVRGDVAYRYRLAGFLAFWQQNYGQVNWQRFPMDETRMLGMYDAYTYQQLAARQNRINARLGAVVASEEAWQGAMSSLRAQDEQAATARYVSDLQYEAERSIQSAKTALSR